MRIPALLAAALLAACAPESRRSFPVGVLGPATPRLEADLRRLGFDLAETLPIGAASVSAASPVGKAGDNEVTADFERIRLLVALTAANGAAGVYLRLAKPPAGRDILDYPEEWQAPLRVLRELQAVKPVLEEGLVIPRPFPVPPGLEARGWSYRGRRYLLLVNSSASDAPVQEAVLEPWRALFEVRSDARQVLKPCGPARCLPPGRVLWLEGFML